MKNMLAFLFAILMISCSKNERSPQNELPSDSDMLIKQLVYLDTTKTVPYDTLSLSTFEYDAAERLTKIIHHTYDPGYGIYTPTGSGISYFYNGTDTVAASCIKTEVLLPSGNIIARNKHFFFYDGVKRLVTDSIIRIVTNGGYDSSVFAYHYSYAGNMVKADIYHYYPSPGYVGSANNLLEKDGRGNVIKNGMGNPWYYYEYDNHLNPLRKTAPINAPYNRSSDFFWLNVTSHIEQINNYSKIYYRTYDAAGNLTGSTLMQESIYEYNSNGFPVSSRKRIYPSSSSQEKYKWVYKY